MIYIDFFTSFIGILKIEADDRYLLRVSLVKKIEDTNNNSITDITKKWFECYFSKNEPKWIPPIIYPKKNFSKKVYLNLLDIPFGSCKTYKELANILGDSKAYRAVANILNKNPYMIIIPCHRVIASKGIGGYNKGIEIKKKILEFEECELINF